MNNVLKELAIGGDKGITFGQFLAVFRELEHRMAGQPKTKPDIDSFKEIKPLVTPQQEDELVIELDTKVLDFLRLLEEYRRKCVEEGNYAEANKAKQKADELKKQYLFHIFWLSPRCRCRPIRTRRSCVR